MPRKLIGPQNAVAAPARMAVLATNRVRTTLRFIPIVWAYRSPSNKALSGLASSMLARIMMTMIGAIALRFSHVTPW